MNKYLGAYIENLDASQLSLGIWGGNAVLTNLHVKGDALKDLDLPVTVLSGFIGKLTLKIPWKNLYKDSVEATLDSLYILAVPNTTVKYDAKTEAERAEKDKQAQLQEIEDQLLQKLEKKDEKQKQDSFAEKLATQVIKNIQIHVKNIHIRFEDRVTNPGHPFAVGVTLGGLHLQTTNENWIPMLLDESVKVIYKMASLNSLAVYWNCKPKLLFSEANRDTKLKEFQSTIARDGFSPSHFDYLIKPLTMDAKLRLNPHPENDISKPKILLKSLLQELGLSLSRVQFSGLIELAESFDRMSINAPFRKFHPTVPLKGNTKLYWKYAYNSVVEAGVRRKLKMFSWKHIKQHRNGIRQYKVLYKEKLKQKNPPKDLVDKLIKMENNFDVFNIILARQSCEVELVKDGIRIKSKKSAHQKEIEESTSWFGGWFGGRKKKKEEEPEAVIDLVMDEEEKELFYEAIGYSEGESPKETNFPKDYVETNIEAVVNLVSLKLIDDEGVGSVLHASLKHISSGFQMLPTMKGIRVDTKMHDFRVDGLKNAGVVPNLIMADFSDEASLKNMPDNTLLSVNFESNPIDETCDQRVDVNARPLRIMYDAETVNTLATFFKPPKDVQLQQIRAAAASTYDDIKDQTATGLKHVMATRKITDINVKFMSSYVVMPKNGRYVEGCEVMVLDLGELVLRSLNGGQTPASKKAFFSDDVSDLEDMRKFAYDKFMLEVNNIQLLISGSNQNWMSSRVSNSSSHHVLEPLSVKLELEKCMIENDSALPKLKVAGELPTLSVKISDRKLESAMELIQSIPYPTLDPTPTSLSLEYETWELSGNIIKKSDMKTMGGVFQDKISSTTTSSDEFFSAESDLSDGDEKTMKTSIRKKSSKESAADAKQLTEVLATFAIGRVALEVARNTDAGDQPLLELSVENFGVTTKVRTWDTSLDAHLGSIKVQYRNPDGTALYLLDTPLYNESKNLLNLNVLIAKLSAPDFLSSYQNIEKCIDVHFSVFQVNANSRAILDIKNFAEKLLPPPPAPSNTDLSPFAVSGKDTTASLTTTAVSIEHSSAQSSGETTGTAGSSDEIPGTRKRKRKRKKRKRVSIPNTEVTKLKLNAVLETFSIKLSDKTTNIADIAIKGIEAAVTIDQSATKVEAKLHNLVISDLTSDSLYRDIVYAIGDDVLRAEIINFKKATLGDGYKDMNRVDTSVMVRFGTLRAVFLKQFVDALVDFGDNFQEAKKLASEAGTAAQKAASESVMKLVERSPRIKLDIFLMAPNIVIPQSSGSLNVILANLGNVTVTNTFNIVGAQSSENPAVCDDMSVKVNEMKLSVCQLDTAHEVTSEYQILEPFSINVQIRRNLAIAWFHEIPDVEIDGSVSDISIKISGSDLSSAMQIINGNLLESESEAMKQTSKKSTVSSSKGRSDTVNMSSPPSSEHIASRDNLKLQFKIGKIRVNLYADATRTFPLAEFLISNLPLVLKMGSDKSLDLRVSLEDITLQDKRLSHQDGISRHISRKRVKSMETGNRIIEANIIQNSDGSMEMNAAVGSLQMILCLEFILKITDVFLSALPNQKLANSENKTTVLSNNAVTLPQSQESLASDSVMIESSPHRVDSADRKSKKMNIKFELHEPDIILVTDMKSNISQALVLNMKLSANVDVDDSGDGMKLQASLSDLQLINCPFSAIQNITSEYKKILSPCNVKFQATLSSEKQDMSISSTKIRIAATPIVINTIAEAVQVLSTETKNTTESAASGVQLQPDIWETKRVSDMQFWFIDNPEKELEAKSSTAVLSNLGSNKTSVSQILRISVPTIQILLESGRGHHTVPLLITEMKFQGEIMDWGIGGMDGNIKLALGVVYFNESLSVWEPLVEPVETDPGNLDSTHELWMVEAIIQQSQPSEDKTRNMSSGSFDELPPLLSVEVKSSKLLHTTLTNDAIKVLQSLGTAFVDAAMVKSKKTPKTDEPDGMVGFLAAEAKIVNMLDAPLNITLGSALAIVAKNGPDKNTHGEYTLGYKDFLAVDVADSKSLDIWELLSNQAKLYDNSTSTITVSLAGGTNSAVFDISKTGISMNTLSMGGNQIPITCIIVSEGGMRNVVIRSPVVLNNHLSVDLKVVDKDDRVISNIPHGETFPLASKYLSGEKLFVKPSGMDVYRAEIDWHAVVNGTDFHVERVIDCPSNYGSNHDVSLNVEIISQQVQSPDKNDTCYEINVYPVVLFKNYLPYGVEYRLINGTKESDSKELISGTGAQLLNAAMKKSKLKIELQYSGKTWLAEMTLDSGISELSVWTFKSTDGSILVLGKQITYDEGYMKIALYSPYWMVNNTGLPLAYKAGDDNISQHEAEGNDFALFSFTSKSFLSKNKLQLRVCNSNFSDSFSIDAVGSSGTITCKSKELDYMVGTRIHLTSFGLTKIVTFTSYYTIINHSSVDLEICEVESATDVITVAPKSKCKFWPISKADELKIRIKGQQEQSPNIRYSRLDSGVLVKVGNTALFVDVSVTESLVTITVQDYYIGSSAVLLVNDTDILDFEVRQAKVSDPKVSVKSKEVKHFLWPCPTGSREVTWKMSNEDKEVTHNVLDELNRELKLKIDGKERTIFYSVFVDGLQRVLLFTENKECAEAVKLGVVPERPNLELDVELQGLSCSITDTKAKQEVMYMAITSSGLVWEEKPKKRWTPLALKYGSKLEEQYQQGSSSRLVQVDNYQFDISKMKVIKPHSASLRRSFSPGISLQYTICDHQVMIHAKINRIQIDNQLQAAVFPVVLYPMPMPKTIAIDNSPKPFVEFSMLQRKSEHLTFPHIKYFQVLVQEFSVKVDMGFISSLLPVFGAGEIKSSPERDLKYFRSDVDYARKTGASEEITDNTGLTFYDALHLSPIKVHVSFSMQNTYDTEGPETNVVILPFNALAVVLKSIGVTISDIDDVIFKLGFFERQYQFFNSAQFTKAITRHYAGQAIKQLYVLVFGLDVIGNPYGLVLGIAEGVQDLFYEPYQGMIQGPAEFAEGLALGAKSLFGHTLGGAAGAVSRVTGAIGKGMAALTMDEEYKRKRQMQKNKPTDVKEGFARGGKGFVMGFVGGVTGVVTKPMEGAKKEGAAGFFKGIGKGLIGIVARPASGVMDLASNTFEGFQKLADMSEDVKRMRPARWIHEDTGVLQPYKLRKAQGKAILLEVEKGKFAKGARYMDHVPMDKNKKSFLVLTDDMILEAHTGEIFGQWNSAWNFSYDEIVEEPHLTNEGIKLVGGKTKKLFGAKTHQRTVTFFNPDYGKHALEYMKRIWSDHQHGRKVRSIRESKSHTSHHHFGFGSHRSKKHTH